MSSGYSRPAGKRKQDNFLEPLLFPGIQALMAGDRRRPLRKGRTSGGPGEVAGPEKGDRPLPSNLSLMTVSYPLPGRSDARGATGGGRLSWFMADPQGAAQVHLIRKDTDYQHCPPTELLSLQHYPAAQPGGRGRDVWL